MNLAALAELDPTLDRVAAGVVKRVLARVQKARAYKHVHAAADAQLPAVQALMMSAFARGHAAISREQLVSMISKEDHAGLMIAVDMAITATANALHESQLHELLLKVLVDSGKTAFNHVKVLRGAAFNEDQPRDDSGKWVDAGGNLTLKAKRTFGDWQSTDRISGKTRAEMKEILSLTRPGGQLEHLRPTDGEYHRGQDKPELERGPRSFASDKKTAKFFGKHLHTVTVDRNTEAIDLDKVKGKGKSEHEVIINVDKKMRGAADPSISTDFVFDDTDPNAVEWAKDHAAELVQGISKTSRDDIRQLVEDAFTEHITADELADEIENVIGDDARAETIARTETMKASNVGQQQAWAQAVDQGLLLGTEQQEWITTPDDKLCPICESLDGQTVGLDESFSDDSGDEYDGPPAHPNCRCTLGLSLEPATAMRAAAYSDDEPRDDHGKWTGGGLYHGTADKSVSSILKTGLTPDDQNRVWLTPQLDRAKSYAYSADNSTAVQSGTVLEIKIPASHAHLLEEVKVGPKAKSGITRLVFKGHIPAKWIKVHSRIENDKWRKLSGDRIIYVGVKEKAIRALYNEDESRDDHGKWTTGGNLSARAKRALATHKPSTAAMQRHAESNETVVAKMVGGTRTEEMQSNAPMDVVKGKHGIEVKTLLNNSNDKITMHPSSRQRKEDYAAKNHAIIHTVVLDDRPGRQNSGHRVYYRRGVGAFRLHTMTPVKNAGHLKQLMEAK